MDTNVRTPQQIFMLPQQLVVPLFQRPYVWEKDEQWEPLWQDVLRMVAVRGSTGAPTAHFLGAVVLQALEGPAGALQEREVIDGQQRLTTLQLLMDAAGAVFEERGLDRFALQMGSLTHNPEQFVPDDAFRLKVRHTNRDRAAFQEVMHAEPPIAHGVLEHSSSRLVAAHEFFALRVGGWLDEAPDDERQGRASALAEVLASGLQLVVIDLQAQEDSQAIFETLNARGTPLTAADLIKNLVFQRLAREGADSHAAYTQVWPFDSTFWETEVSVGRTTTTQGALFLNQWLTSTVAEDVRPRGTFARFKHYVEHESGRPMLDLLREIRAQADLYEAWTRAAADRNRSLSRVETAVYRMRAIGSEALKPVLLRLHRPGDDLPAEVVDQVVGLVESWLVRRTLLRLASADHGRAVAGLLQAMRAVPADELVQRVSDTLRSFRVASTYWPGDQEIRRALREERVYRRFPRARLRMVLEAIEDDLRSGFGNQQVVRNQYPIEHLLPQSWEKHWPVDGLEAQLARDAHVHRLGNLTLLTQPLNGAVSNSAWLGRTGKLSKIRKHDLLLLNRDVAERGADGWDEARINARTERLLDTLLRLWPVPDGHTGEIVDAPQSASTWISLADLVNDGLVAAGTVLTPRPGSWPATTATVAADGQLIVGGKAYSPSAAGKLVKGAVTNGWTFWLLDDGRQLADVRKRYRSAEPAQMPDALADVWDPQTDQDDAEAYWNLLGETARAVFTVLVEAAPERVPAPVVAERAGLGGVANVAGALAYTNRIAQRFGHTMPARHIEGEPSAYWMDESTAETFAAVVAGVQEARSEVAALAPEWAEAVTSAAGDEVLLPLLRELGAAGNMPVPSVGDEVGDGVPTLLAWPELRIAVLAPGQDDLDARVIRDAGWTTLLPDSGAIATAVRAAALAAPRR